MKKKLFVLLAMVTIFALFLAGCGGGGSSTDSSDTDQKETQNQDSDSNTDTSWEDIKAKGYFIVGLDDNFPPMGFRDDKGEIVGFDIDMAKEAAKRMGVEVKFQPVEWDGVTMSLRNGDIDLIWNGLSITEERKQVIDFSKPYIDNNQIIVTMKGSPLRTKADLAGKILGYQLGSSSEVAVSADAKTAESLKEIKKYPTFSEALMDLENGRIDAVCIDGIAFYYYNAKRPGTYDVMTGEGDNFGTEQMAVGIRKTDKAFAELLNQTLDEMKADGTAGKICTEWFGEDLIVK
jgi:polar amino acid transport system substrate-binding protein